MMFECRMDQLVLVPLLHCFSKKMPLLFRAFEDHTPVSELIFCVCTLYTVVDLGSDGVSNHSILDEVLVIVRISPNPLNFPAIHYAYTVCTHSMH